MIVILRCQNCKIELSEQEVKSNTCCPKCGAWLKVSREVMPEPHKKSESKVAFVKMLYANVKTQQGSSCQECDECFQRNFRKPLCDQLKKCPGSEMANFTAKPCFPPIGSSNEGQILFVGTNPRLKVGSSDEGFYLYPMKDEACFIQFSRNGYYEYKGQPRHLLEISHYKIHRLAMQTIGLTLGEDSSVAELFMCASNNSSNLREGWNAMTECVYANRYLVDYMKIVKPRLVVCLGSPSKKWFMNQFSKNMKCKKITVNDSLKEFAPECFKVQLTPSLSTTVLFTLHPGDWNTNKSRLHRVFLEVFEKLAKQKKHE